MRAPFNPLKSRRFNVKRFLFISAVYGLLSFTACYSEAQVPPEDLLVVAGGGCRRGTTEWNLMLLQQQLYNNSPAQVDPGSDSPHDTCI